jgi:hypothetical protein
MKTPNGLLDDAGARERLTVTSEKLKELRLRREIPYLRLGHRTIRYRRDDLEAYLSRIRVAAVWEGVQ